MMKLIAGEKGNGKTKVLIDMVNQAAETTTGNVVCIEKAMTLQYSIKPSVRLIHVDEYAIEGYDQFYGFLCGVLAGNYDIKDIFIDGILRIGDHDLEGLATLLAKIEKLMTDDLTIVITVSTDPSKLPPSLSAYL